MANTILSTSECVWSQVSVEILGRKLTGLRGFEFKKTKEKEHVYGSGSDPIDIQSGNNKYEGNLKLLKYEVDLLNDAAQAASYTDILEVPHTLIAVVVQYKKLDGSPIRTLKVPGLGFTELGLAMEQSAKMTEITLPFLAMKFIHDNKLNAA